MSISSIISSNVVRFFSSLVSECWVKAWFALVVFWFEGSVGAGCDRIEEFVPCLLPAWWVVCCGWSNLLLAWPLLLSSLKISLYSGVASLHRLSGTLQPSFRLLLLVDVLVAAFTNALITLAFPSVNDWFWVETSKLFGASFCARCAFSTLFATSRLLFLKSLLLSSARSSSKVSVC